MKKFLIAIASLIVLSGCKESANKSYKNPLEKLNGSYKYPLEKLLEIEDVYNENSIPLLEKFIQVDDGRIHQYAAAQALFMIDSKESHELLEQYLFSSPNVKFNFEASIRYMFHWGMPSKNRDEFIKRYHLRSTSNQLSLMLKSTHSNAKKNTVEINLVLKNESEEPLQVYKPDVYHGSHVLLVSLTGEVMEPVMSTKYTLRRRPYEESHIEILPNETYEFGFAAEVKTFPNSPSAEFRTGLWLDCGDFMHKLSSTGKYKIYGHYVCENNRIVSEPITIKLEH